MELIFLRIILRCYKTFIKTEYINIDQKRIREKQRHFPSQIQMQLESVSELRLEGIKKEIHRNVLASDGSLLHLRWHSNSEGNRGTL
uniref:Ovule protein n=1 Tax=Ascaris lumbricoides TaxID=6252 RepID=A0A0M3ICA7_ASCLU